MIGDKNGFVDKIIVLAATVAGVAAAVVRNHHHQPVVIICSCLFYCLHESADVAIDGGDGCGVFLDVGVEA